MLHRHHLLLIGQPIRLPEVVEEEICSPCRPRTRMDRGMEGEPSGNKRDRVDMEQESSESEDEGPLHSTTNMPRISPPWTRAQH